MDFVFKAHMKNFSFKISCLHMYGAQLCVRMCGEQPFNTFSRKI